MKKIKKIKEMRFKVSSYFNVGIVVILIIDVDV